MKRFLDWLRSLLAKFSQVLEKPDANTPITTQEVIRLGQPPVGIDYSRYVMDPRTEQRHTPYTLQTMGVSLPAGWDWKEWAKVAGVADPTNHDAGGRKVEQFAPREYRNQDALDINGKRETLLNVPGILNVSSNKAFVLNYEHGVGSKGAAIAVANGLNLGGGPNWTLGPGEYAIDFGGEATRIAVAIRPAL